MLPAYAVRRMHGDTQMRVLMSNEMPRALHGCAHPWMSSVTAFRDPMGRCFSASAIAGWQQDGSGTTTTPSFSSPAIARPGFDPKHDRVGVILLNLGGPDTLDDVRPFLYNLFADPEIIRLPRLIAWLQPAIAFAISSSRARKSREGYAAIGGGSPLRRITEEQAAALATALRKAGIPADVTVAMRYWYPTSEQALAEMKSKGINKLVVLPLYPQYSLSTSGSSLRLLRQLIAADPPLRALRTAVVPSWFGRAGYVSAYADLIHRELQKLPETDAIHIFFSAHGVPAKYVAQGDPYQVETERCVELIMTELRRRGVPNQHTLAYQSRVGPLEWLKPYTDEAIRELGSQGVRGLLAVPISFVSEHIETLEEMDVEYRDLAKSSGVEIWGRVPALNTYPPFIEDLAKAVIEALPQMDQIWEGKKAVEPLAPSGTIVATDLDTAADYRLPAQQSTSRGSKDHPYFWRALKDLATFGGGGSYLK